MLQVNHRQVVNSPTNVALEEASSLSDLVDFFGAILSREYLLILAMTVLALGLGGLYIYITPPSYRPARRCSSIEGNYSRSSAACPARCP